MPGRPWMLIVVLSLAVAVAGAQTESKNMPNSPTEEAIALMLSFAERTGLDSERRRQRYLWTDAFAVCNFLGLARVTGEVRYRELALRLVDQVHHTLGRHRSDDPRSGWISGLSEREGEAHPTRGGLRIGKKFPERTPDVPFDERLEWDRDGQYFHYLTKWMHCLDQVARVTGEPRFNLWARELAETAYDAFTYVPFARRGPRRMYWKMSVDLTRPLVTSMGQHDPLDGYVTAVQLRSTAAALSGSAVARDLEDATRQFAAMIAAAELTTPDPLGIGGLLTDAYRVDQLLSLGALPEDDLLENLLTAALTGLQYYAGGGELRQPAEFRLAFRELGLAIGLRAVAHMWRTADSDSKRSSTRAGVHARLQALMEYVQLGEEIESFWRDPEHRAARTWSEHRDINDVMLATSLMPDGFLVLLPTRAMPAGE